MTVWHRLITGGRSNKSYLCASPIWRLWIAQGGDCFHCHEPMLRAVAHHHPLRWSREHLFPRSRYLATPDCVVLAHRRCNTERGAAEPTEAEIRRAKSIYLDAELQFRIPPLAAGQAAR